MPQAAEQLDTRIEIVTPENIAFHYRVAGPFRRMPALLVDLFLQTVLMFGAFLLLLFSFGAVGFGGIGVGLGLTIVFVVSWFYGGLFETFWNGQTPGKRMMNIRVITTDGQPIHGWQAVLRNVLRTADFLPVGYLLGIVVAMVNERFQRLGDLFAGTMVVVEEPQRLYGVMRVDEPAVVELAAALPAGFRVSRSLARALATYVQRRRGFPWGRRIEIARHLGEPLRVRFNLPISTSYDLLLCALYHRTFIEDRPPE